MLESYMMNSKASNNAKKSTIDKKEEDDDWEKIDSIKMALTVS